MRKFMKNQSSKLSIFQKSLTFLGVIFTMLFGCTVTSFADNFTDSFDNGLGNWTINSGWSTVNPGGYNAAKASGAPYYLSRSLSSNQSDGSIEVLADFFETDKYHYPFFPLAGSGNSFYAVAAKDDGHFGYYDGSSYHNFPIDTTYVKYTWYKINVYWHSNGTYQVYIDGTDVTAGGIAAKDSAGNTVTSISTIQFLNTSSGSNGGMFLDYVTYDTSIPTGNIKINGGGTATNSSTVSLTISATNASQMQVSNDPFFYGASWETYSTSKTGWNLNAGYGNKTVYIRFKDAYGNISSIYKDSILVDNISPDKGTISINGGTGTTNNSSVNLTLSAADREPGANGTIDAATGAYVEHNHDIAEDTQGNFYIVYSASYSSHSRIFIKKSEDRGVTWKIWNGSGFVTSGTPSPIDGQGNYDQEWPSIAIDSNDNIHVTWHGKCGTSTTYYQLWYKKYIKSSNTWGSIKQITNSSNGNYDQGHSSIAIDNSGNMMIVWDGGTSTAYENIKYITYIAGSWGSVQVLYSGGGYSQEWTQVVSDDSGNFYLVWYGRESSTDPYKIYYSKYTNSVGWSTPTKFYETSYWERNPTIALDNNGNIYVAWEEWSDNKSSDSTFFRLYFKKYNVSTSSWGNAVKILDLSYYIDRPSIALDGNNNIYIMFEGPISAISNAQIRYVKSTNGGTSWNSTVNLTSGSFDQKNVSILKGADGYIWQGTTNSNGVSSGDAGVMFSTFDAQSTDSGISQMMISNYSNFTTDGKTPTTSNTVSWETYSTTKNWTLSNGDGNKTVYIKFKDAAGNESSQNSDTIKLDSTPPTVKSTSPTDGEAGVAVNSNITVTFSENIDNSTAWSNIVLKDSAGTKITTSTPTLSGAVLTINPSANLNKSTTYTVVIPASAVKDGVGNNLASDYKFSFTTVDTTAPTVTSTTPTNGKNGVAVGNDITVTFSENVVKSSAWSSITLKNSSGTTVTTSNSISGAILTMDPSANLSGLTKYIVTIPASAVKDNSGNNLASQYTFSFTTIDNTPPTVTSTSPVDGTTGVAVGSDIKVTFSENVVQSSAWSSVVLKNSSGTAVATSNSVTGKILTISPTVNLNESTTYTVTVPASAVKDSDGNNLASAYTFKFTTPIFKLNTITISGSRYYGDSVTLQADGSSIVNAKYRIFSTKAITAPDIADDEKAASPGNSSDWTDTGVDGDMDISGNINISKVLDGSNFNSSDGWTYVTFKVYAESPSGKNTWKYSEAYSLTDSSVSIDEPISYVGHNQIIRSQVATSPTAAAPGYNVSTIKAFNVYAGDDKIDYRLEFDLDSPIKVDGLKLKLDLNSTYEDGIQLKLDDSKGMRLVKLSGTDYKTTTPIKTFDSSAFIQAGEGNDTYTLTIGSSDIPTTLGRYAIEYYGDLSVVYTQDSTPVTITNEAELSYIKKDTGEWRILQSDAPNRKMYINTLVTRKYIKYR